MVDVLVIDDEANFLKDLAEGLRLYSKKLFVVTTNNAEKALEILRTAKIDVVVTDLRMPGMGGTGFLREVCDGHPHLPVIIMSACAKASMHKELQGLTYAGYLEKPVELKGVADAILHAVSAAGRWETRKGMGLPPRREKHHTSD